MKTAPSTTHGWPLEHYFTARSMAAGVASTRAFVLRVADDLPTAARAMREKLEAEEDALVRHAQVEGLTLGPVRPTNAAKRAQQRP